MITEEEYHLLAKESYSVDSKKEDEPIVKGDTISNSSVETKFKVLSVKDNLDNGMQAMAVAPIDSKTGKVDTSQVVIAYAGTNAKDDLDIFTDVQTVGLSSNELVINKRVRVDYNANNPSSNFVTTQFKTDAQSVTALKFADEIRKLYPNSIISTTGHSLGEYLAMMVAAENQWINVGFNGPDAYNILSKEAKEWIKNNPGMLINFRNRGDAIGNLMGNGTGAEVLISLDMGLNPFKGAFHNISTWKFDDNGKLIIPNSDYNKNSTQQQAENQLMREFVIGMYALEVLKAKFKVSGGGISMNEQIYLDDSQALAVVQLASSEFELVMTNTIKIYQEGIDKLENKWRETRSNALNDTSELSYHEVMDILSSVSCTEQKMVTMPSEFFKQKIDKAKQMSEKFNSLASEIKAKIAELVQRDSDLARQLMS